ncbi:amidase domain-containing protein [Amnibacterium sp.]|uniref:amidase domain-containing protein n=1 Tax=Amnibacterium sp. TaxID=1872496 RepID=UPI003F7B4444
MTARTTTITTALAAAIVGALALGAAAPAEATTPTPAPSVSASTTPAPGTSTSAASPSPAPDDPPTADPSPTPTPTPVVPLPQVATIDKHVGHTTASRTATITGTHLLNLAGVQIAGVAMPDLVVLSDDLARFVIPNAIDYQARTAAITTTAYSDPTAQPTGLTFQYRVTSKLDRQMAYAFRYWNVSSNRTFGYLSGNDCANFASQTLLARGWKRSSQWFDYGPGRWSPTWVSSTALSRWLQKRKDLATHLTYAQRDLVSVGDIVQFRWPGHPKSYSSWDHTAIVSKVVVLPNGRHDIFYVAHTTNRQYGGSTGALAAWYSGQRIKGSTLHIQFFHLRR